MARILAVATHVLEREPLARFTTNRVAEAGDVGIGPVYRYFPNKDAPLVALIERAQARHAARLSLFAEAPHLPPPTETVESLARLAVSEQFGRPRLASALAFAQAQLPVQHVLDRTDGALEQAVRRVLDRTAFDLRLSRDAARDSLALAKALVDAEARRTDVAPPDLEGRPVRALMGYLLGEAAPDEAFGVRTARRRPASTADRGATRSRGRRCGCAPRASG